MKKKLLLIAVHIGCYCASVVFAQVIPGKTYKLINPISNKALTVQNDGTTDGTNVHLWQDDNLPGQRWQVFYKDCHYKLVNTHSGKTLDILNSGTTDGTNVQIKTGSSASVGQKWHFINISDSTYYLFNPNSGKALDVKGAGTANGTNVHIWSINATAAQKWRLVRIAPDVPSLDLSEYTLLRDYNFGTAASNTVGDTAALAVNFKPYGVAGTTVINSEWQRYKPFNNTNHHFALHDLELTALPNQGGITPGGISSGQITTKETFYPSNGKTYVFTVRAKIPRGHGTWPAFWMYSPGGSGSTNSEIDIFEFFNSPTQDTDDWTGFDHGSGVGEFYYSIMTNQWVWHSGFDFADDYHVYTLVWKEGNIQKWVDSTLVTGRYFTWFGPAPQVLINLAIGGTPNSPPTAADTPFPSRFMIDYFRVYVKDPQMSSTSTAPVAAVSKHQASPGLILYPNPTDDQLTLNTAIQSGYLRIWDSGGNLVWESTVPEDGIVKLNGFKSGLFTIQVTDGRNTFTERFVRQ